MAPGPGCALDWCVPHAGLPPPLRRSGAPGPGCRPPKNTTQTGITDVHHQSNHAVQDTNDQRDGNSPPPKLGTRHSHRTRPTVPSTVLGADMGDGSLFLQCWPDALSAYLHLPDTVPRKRALAAALGSTELAFRDDQGDAL
jgi:hypothetical protein